MLCFERRWQLGQIDQLEIAVGAELAFASWVELATEGTGKQAAHGLKSLEFPALPRKVRHASGVRQARIRGDDD